MKCECKIISIKLVGKVIIIIILQFADEQINHINTHSKRNLVVQKKKKRE